MSNPNEIRRHIAAVEQTKKITGAMEMVSSNRMRKVMSHIEHNHRYFEYVQKTMKELITSSQNISHPYLNAPTGDHCLFVILSGDKGLCGSYNSTILNYALKRIEETENRGIMTIGNTAYEFFLKRGMVPDIDEKGTAQDPTLERARKAASDMMWLYSQGTTHEIHVIYTSFYGETKNKLVERRLLPIRLDDYESVTDVESLNEILYHPSAKEVFDNLVPQYVIGIMFGVMVQAYASEHYARMNAMRSATTNAKDMLKELEISYNLARQSAITNEISEITGAAEILKGEVQYGG